MRKRGKEEKKRRVEEERREWRVESGDRRKWMSFLSLEMFQKNCIEMCMQNHLDNFETKKFACNSA